jgi:hypothetical protein
MNNNKQSFNSKDNKIRYTRIINAENARTFTDEIGGLTWKRLTTIDIIQQLQEINTISTWLYVNKLSINITKTKFILLKQKRENRIIR